MDFNHFVQLVAIGLQARIPMHITGYPGIGKTEFTKSLEAAFTRAGVKCKVIILIGSIREPQDFGGFPVSTPEGVRLLPMAWAREAKRLARRADHGAADDAGGDAAVAHRKRVRRVAVARLPARQGRCRLFVCE
jgi:hypothetical protein